MKRVPLVGVLASFHFLLQLMSSLKVWRDMKRFFDVFLACGKVTNLEQNLDMSMKKDMSIMLQK